MENRQEQNELNDILIKREDSSATRIKNIFMVSAALLLIIVIGVLTYRIIENSGEQAAADPTSANGGEETMFEAARPPVPTVGEEPKSALDEIIARHREQRQNDLNASAAAPVAAPVQTPPPPTETVVTPPARTTPSAPTTGATKPATPSAAQSTPAKPTKPAATATPAAATASGFYIQVESLSKTPSEGYLKLIRDRGYSVSVKDRVVDGKVVHRVYIGPYTHREAAVAVLPNIKRDYNPDAFVTQE
ncbi:hypothetical protein AGMMS50229_08070 [Campylobacterota bacterium]|nr:hypothetical protein AGMMS50229_08070 [Campylobacterota bacterium]